jgi:hypothetical protein
MNGSSVEDLVASSPVKFDAGTSNSEEVIDQLFPGNPLLCCARDQRHSETKPREAYRGTLSSYQFIVPTPMTQERGRTKEGKLSARSLDNVGPRKFLVIEIDISKYARDGTTETGWSYYFKLWNAYNVTVADVCAALLVYLAGYWPLALVVSSGGKSLHGWFPVGKQTEASLRRFMRHACYLGCDPATWTTNQLVRLPGGVRDGGTRQGILYFNPAALYGAE